MRRRLERARREHREDGLPVSRARAGVRERLGLRQRGRARLVALAPSAGHGHRARAEQRDAHVRRSDDDRGAGHGHVMPVRRTCAGAAAAAPELERHDQLAALERRRVRAGQQLVDRQAAPVGHTSASSASSVSRHLRRRVGPRQAAAERRAAADRRRADGAERLHQQRRVLGHQRHGLEQRPACARRRRSESTPAADLDRAQQRRARQGRPAGRRPRSANHQLGIRLLFPGQRDGILAGQARQRQAQHQGPRDGRTSSSTRLHQCSRSRLPTPSISVSELRSRAARATRSRR